MSLAAILGSAHDRPMLGARPLESVQVATRWGPVALHRLAPERWVLFRHGLPHRLLPHQIPWRAQAAALAEVGCSALLVTSSCGVLDPDLPLFEPLVVGDLLMPDNRLPDGSACTLFDEPQPGQGHLVVEEGLLSRALSDRLAELGGLSEHRVVFAYTPGPRTKTAAENRYWRQLGAQVNSMTLGPEVVLANELGISTAAVAVGHKYSVPGWRSPLDQEAIAATLVRTRQAMDQLVLDFLERAEPVPFANRLYRF